MWMIKRLFVLGLLLLAVYRIDELEQQVADLENKQPVIIYTVDNAGAAMSGKVTGKEIVNGKYTLDCGIYGKFLVTKEVYDSVQVGDEIPEYLKKVGSK